MGLAQAGLWCSIHKIQFRDNMELIELTEVIERFNKKVREVNKSLGEFEHIKRFCLVTEEWTPLTRELEAVEAIDANVPLKPLKQLEPFFAYDTLIFVILRLSNK